jgi:SAM-dependent methyltransferase
MANYEGFADLERKGWANDSNASGYVDLFSSASDLAIPALVAGVKNCTRVLDLCCGQGNVTEALLREGMDVVGADFSPAMLAHAHRRMPNAEFVEADAQDLPFEDGEFDAVICSFGIMHIPDQPRALSQVRRVLKPQGIFAMAAWCGPEISPVFEVFYGCVQEHGSPDVAVPESPNFHQFANKDQAELLFGEAGFSLSGLQIVDCYWTLSSAEEVAEIFEQGAPRAGYLLTQQPEESRAAIKDAVAAKVRERFSEGNKFHVPIPAAIVTATTI